MLAENHPVPVFHAPADGPVVARLVFGVGTCDEPVRLAGITHLVEHLVVRGALPIAEPHNATTDDWVTFFEVVSTTTDGALEVLARIAGSATGLVHVTESDLVRERAVLRREDELRFAEQVASVHTARFGPAGPGRSGAGAAAAAGVVPAEVAQWVSERFVAQNAVVTVVGGTAPPEYLLLDLPSGAAAGALPEWTGRCEGGTLVESALGGIAASILVPASVAPLADAVIEHELFDALRVDAGLAYAVDGHSLTVDADTSVVAVAVDTAPEDTAAALEIVVGTFRRVATHGPSTEVVARIDAARELNDLDRTGRADAMVTEAAMHALRGLPRPGVSLAPVSAAEVDELRTALVAALPSLLVCIDEDAEVDGAELARRHDLDHQPSLPGRQLRPGLRMPRVGRRTFRDAFVPGFASVHVDVDGTELVVRPRGGDARVIDLREAAVIGTRGDAGLTIVDADGNQFQIRTDDWWRGRRFIEAVLQAAPPHLVRPFSD